MVRSGRVRRPQLIPFLSNKPMSPADGRGLIHSLSAAVVFRPGGDTGPSTGRRLQGAVARGAGRPGQGGCGLWLGVAAGAVAGGLGDPVRCGIGLWLRVDVTRSGRGLWLGVNVTRSGVADGCGCGFRWPG